MLIMAWPNQTLQPTAYSAALHKRRLSLVVERQVEVERKIKEVLNLNLNLAPEDTFRLG